MRFFSWTFEKMWSKQGCKYMQVTLENGNYYLTWHYFVNILHIEIVMKGSVLTWLQTLTDYWIFPIRRLMWFDQTDLTWLGLELDLTWPWPGAGGDGHPATAALKGIFLLMMPLQFKFRSCLIHMVQWCHGHVMVIGVMSWSCNVFVKFQKTHASFFVSQIVERDDLRCLYKGYCAWGPAITCNANGTQLENSQSGWTW